MYYEEKIENGKLYYRTSNNGEWIEADYLYLLQRYAVVKQVRKEQHAHIAELEAQLFEFAKYLDHTTGSRISKTNYTFETMLGVFDEHLKDLIKYALEDIAEQNES